MSDLTERARTYLDGWRYEEGHAIISELVDRIEELEAALREARYCISRHQGGCINGCFEHTGRALEADAGE